MLDISLGNDRSGDETWLEILDYWQMSKNLWAEAIKPHSSIGISLEECLTVVREQLCKVYPSYKESIEALK